MRGALNAQLQLEAGKQSALLQTIHAYLDHTGWLLGEIAKLREDNAAFEETMDGWHKRVDELKVENARFREALQKAVDTFDDYAKGLRVFGKPTAAEGLEIAARAIRRELEVDG